jgi:hypothetical protein
MHMVDDATPHALGWFSAEESIWAAVAVLRRWIERYGVPQALYTDWKNVYVRPPNAQERMRGEAAVTQFGRMCAKLGIEIIAARSPQAKGRVERAHGTHQDRLVKKLRLAGIDNYDQANAYLDQHYLAEHNRRYAHAAAAAADYHRPTPDGAATGRSLLAGGRTRGQRRLGGALPEPTAATRTAQPTQGTAKSRVLVRENQAGEVAIHYCNHCLVFREWKAASTAPSEARGAAPSPAPPSPKPKSCIPAVDHPCRKNRYQHMKTPIFSSAW